MADNPSVGPISFDLPAIPADYQKAFEALHREVAWLSALWRTYRELYENPDVVKLLNEAAGSCFRVLQLTLHDNIVIRISKLTDEPKSRGHSHLTLHVLREMGRAAGLTDDIKKMLGRASDIFKELCKLVETIRDHRNSRIAHHDLHLATVGVKLDPIDHKELGDVMEKIWRYINVFHDHFRGSSVAYNGNWLANNAQTAVNVLAHGLRLMAIQDIADETGDDKKVADAVRQSFPIPRIPI